MRIGHQLCFIASAFCVFGIIVGIVSFEIYNLSHDTWDECIVTNISNVTISNENVTIISFRENSEDPSRTYYLQPIFFMNNYEINDIVDCRLKLNIVIRNEDLESIKRDNVFKMGLPLVYLMMAINCISWTASTFFDIIRKVRHSHYDIETGQFVTDHNHRIENIVTAKIFRNMVIYGNVWL